MYAILETHSIKETGADINSLPSDSETLKLKIRGKTISCAAYKKKQNNTVNFLEVEINFPQQSLNVSPCEETKRKLAQK